MAPIMPVQEHHPVREQRHRGAEERMTATTTRVGRGQQWPDGPAGRPGAPERDYREGRIEPPPMPQGQVEIQPPPALYVGESMASNVMMTAIPMVGSLASVIFVAMSNTGPVSYTHLDVYKRQNLLG